MISMWATLAKFQPSAGPEISNIDGYYSIYFHYGPSSYTDDSMA